MVAIAIIARLMSLSFTFSIILAKSCINPFLVKGTNVFLSLSLRLASSIRFFNASSL